MLFDAMNLNTVRPILMRSSSRSRTTPIATSSLTKVPLVEPWSSMVTWVSHGQHLGVGAAHRVLVHPNVAARRAADGEGLLVQVVSWLILVTVNDDHRRIAARATAGDS